MRPSHHRVVRLALVVPAVLGFAGCGGGEPATTTPAMRSDRASPRAAPPAGDQGTATGTYVIEEGLSASAGEVSQREAGPGIKLTFERGSQRQTVKVAAGGRFTVELPVGEWKVVQPDGGQRSIAGDLTFEIQPDETTQIELRSVCNVC